MKSDAQKKSAERRQNQMAVLAVIQASEAGARCRDISEALGFSLPMVSRILRQLSYLKMARPIGPAPLARWVCTKAQEVLAEAALEKHADEQRARRLTYFRQYDRDRKRAASALFEHEKPRVVRSKVQQFEKPASAVSSVWELAGAA